MDPTDPDTHPRLRADIAMVGVDDCLVIGLEANGRLASFDPMSALLVEALDGSSTLDDLTDDLTAAGVAHDQAERSIRRLVDALGRDGFLQGVVGENVTPRRVEAPIPATSCLGVRMGLGRAELRTVPGTRGFRFGATMPGLTERLSSAMRSRGVDVRDDEDHGQDMILLRASPGRTSRLQQLFSSLGRRWYAGRDLELAIEAFCRTVEARCRLMSGGTWIEGVALMRNGRAVLVQPGLEDVVLGDLRPEFEASGITQIPCGVLELVDGRVVVSADPVSGADRFELDIVAALVPYEVTALEATRQLLYLTSRWDDQHFAALQPVLDRCTVLHLSTFDRPDAIAERLTALTDTSL